MTTNSYDIARRFARIAAHAAKQAARYGATFEADMAGECAARARVSAERCERAAERGQNDLAAAHCNDSIHEAKCARGWRDGAARNAR